MELRLIASVFIVNDKNEVLLVQEGKESMRGLWNLPGGHVESGEDFLSGAIREAKEETGLTVKPSHILTMFRPIENDMLHCIFLVRDFEGELTIGDSNILQVKWVPLLSFPEMTEEFLRPQKMRILKERLENNDLVNLDLFVLEQKDAR